MLFEEEGPYAQDMSKFYNPKIQKVSVIVEGKPNQLYAQGMRSFELYAEVRKYFAEGVQRDNEVQKQLALHDVSLGEYLTGKCDVCCDMLYMYDITSSESTWILDMCNSVLCNMI